jgi:hypothetical protein
MQSNDFLTIASLKTDPTYDILRSERQPLGAIFAPETVAVIGSPTARLPVWH